MTNCEKIDRPNSEYMDSILGQRFDVLDHGFIRVIDYMGDDNAVIQAARVSYGKGTKAVNEDRGLIRYLMRHYHTTPFEMCEIKLHVKLPVFVARQWIRHRTANVNEYSARYSILDGEFYLPQPEQMMFQSTDNKQGRQGVMPPEMSSVLLRVLKEDATRAYRNYEHMTYNNPDDPNDPDNVNFARELARINLPTSIYTQWYWKTDLHNLLHFLRLRADSHAQFEIRQYAETISDIIGGWVPLVREAAEDYLFSGVQLSRMELMLVREIIKSPALHDAEVFDHMGRNCGMSGREIAALRSKLQLP